jgi:hypothetical protein
MEKGGQDIWKGYREGTRYGEGTVSGQGDNVWKGVSEGAKGCTIL